MNLRVLQQPVTVLKGIGSKTGKLFEKCGITTIEELLRYYPKGYDIFEPPISLAEVQDGMHCALCCTLVGEPSIGFYSGKTVMRLKGTDGSGQITLSYFNAPYLKKVLQAGEQKVFRGVVKKRGNTLSMDQPKFYTTGEYLLLQNSMQPNYSLVKGLSNHAIQKAMKEALLQFPTDQDLLPEKIRKKEGFVSLFLALHDIHFPKDRDSYLQARKRLAFDEFYFFLARLKERKEAESTSKNHWKMIETADASRLIEALPYELTQGQQKVFQDIRQDLCSDHTMNRLIQGDVGSGKTILAFLALLMCASNGFQGAIMAPTAVLAAQHFAQFTELTRRYHLPIHPVLLTGSSSAREKKEIYHAIAAGEYNVIVGTHALFQEKVIYKNLALVVTDEQHRFGVRQRDFLAGKGRDVHVLSMSATPIPRSLALILYADLQVSPLKERPDNRKPIKNAIVDASYRQKAYQLIIKKVREGRQAYIICPMVEEGELEGVQNVTAYTQMLSRLLPNDIRMEKLHGRMRSEEKDRIMENFAAHHIDVLISTTVIEVGINVPNASVMMIEDAQRFGLAQLHQLRGRVGRGEEQSFCIFVDTSGGKASKRLEILGKTNDGFEIAEEDLKLRGPGELFGLRQSGELSFQIADIYRDADLLFLAKNLLPC